MFEHSKPPEETPPDYTGLKIVGILSPVFFLFAYFDQPDVGLSCCMVLGMVVLAIRFRWELRSHVWFWPVILVLLVCHLPLIFAFRWPHGKTPVIAYTIPLGVVDFALVFGVLGLADRLFSSD
jgi:hypothetical protein